jgi:branched-chain amino acid aminotransferase
MKIWMDGQLLEKEDATISVLDHCVLYGDGVFEGIRVYGGKVFQCDAHVDRLFASAEGIRLKIPYSKQQIVDAMYEAIAANGKDEAYIRLVITRGVGTLGLNPFLCEQAHVFCICSEIALYPPEMYEKGMSVIIAKTRRCSADMLSPSVKSCNYLNNIRAKIEAIDAGVPEAIMLNAAGNVAECTGDNLFLVTGGTVVTPDVASGILVGVTRNVVMQICRQQGIELVDKTVTVDELLAADECFLTGTAAEVIAVTDVDGKKIGDGGVGPVTRQLLGAFREYIRQEVQAG